MDARTLQAIKQRYGIVGDCDALNHALKMAARIAPVDLSVLVLGENGSGKEHIPHIIHDGSSRKNHKLLSINCGAIPEGTIDSELFGHVKGAFTGSVTSRKGYFAAADGGTLFLDEVGELPLQTQVRLLRVLETGEYIPVGSNDICKTNVRIVAATNVDLQRAIRDGRFREDLYYRLAGAVIKMPPLRERGQDIDLLFRKFALDASDRYNMPPVRLSETARQIVLGYDWPGNIRQLRHVVETLSVISDEREIRPEALKDLLQQRAPTARQMALVPQQKQGQSEHAEQLGLEFLYKAIVELRRDLDQLRSEVEDLKAQRNITPRSLPPRSHFFDNETATNPLFADAEEIPSSPQNEPASKPQTLKATAKQEIEEALRRSGGNRKAAATALGISDRTLYRKIKDYGLE